MNEDQVRARVRELAREAGDGTGWFETLYAGANGDPKQIPWADLKPNKNLVTWLERERPRARAVRALVVGCGLGDDAELLARWQFDVTAFDLSPTAIAWCKRRFLSTHVRYVAGDLLSPPPEWVGGWDFVFEAYTVQAMSPTLKPQAMTALASLVSPGGQLLLISRGREDHEDVQGPPWPLTHADLGRLNDAGLRMTSFEDFEDDESIRRFRAAFVRD